jgi:hypothetical protein
MSPISTSGEFYWASLHPRRKDEILKGVAVRAKIPCREGKLVQFRPLCITKP